MSACVIGLDLSLTGTGFCKLSDGKIEAETIKTTPKTCPNDLARLRHICNEIMRRVPVLQDVEMVCVEDFFTPQNPFQIGAAINLAMLGATVRLALYEAGYPFYVVSPGQIKKYITGKGVGQKSIVIREVYKKYGLDVKDDNQADACVLAHIANDLAWWPMRSEGIAKYQVEVLEKIIADRPRYNVKEPAKQ